MLNLVAYTNKHLSFMIGSLVWIHLSGACGLLGLTQVEGSKELLCILWGQAKEKDSSDSRDGEMDSIS